MNRILLAVPLVGSFLVASLVGAAESDWVWGAGTGERLQYRLDWMGVPSGRATTQMKSGPGHDYTVETTFSTLGAARLFRVIDDRITVEGHRQESNFTTHRYVKDQHRGDQKWQFSYQFDREMRQVLRLYQHPEEPQGKTAIPLGTDDVIDPLSLFYAVRGWPELLPNHTLERQVVDGEKVFCLTFAIGGSRLLHTALGNFQVFPLRMTVENSESLRQRGPIVLWLTDDHRRIPVQVEAQIAIGSVVAELVAFDDGRGESRQEKENP